MTTEFDDMLNTDPILEAEKLTGKSYKEDEETLHLGVLMHIAKGRAVSEELSLRNDTHMRVTWEDALAIYADLGFVEVFSEDFVDNSYDELRTETYKVFWRNGFLLTAESYWDHKSVNSSNIYYNWAPNEDVERPHHFTSSGFYNTEAYDNGEKIWIGYHDAREGLRNIISNLESHGKILENWVEAPFLWLLNFSVPKQEGYSYKDENKRVISKFPNSVQDAIVEQN